MNNNLILEIDRVKSLMGLSDSNSIKNLQIINEVVASRFKNYLMLLKDVDEVGEIEKVLIKMKELAPRKIKITPEEIETLAKEIFLEKEAISTAAKNNQLGTLGNSNSAYKKFEKFKTQVSTALNKSVDNDVTFDTHVQMATEKIFNNPNGEVYKAHIKAVQDVQDLLVDEVGQGTVIKKDLIKEWYVDEFKKNLKSGGTEFKENDPIFEPLKKWLDKKFDEQVLRWQQDAKTEGQDLVFDDKPTVNLESIKKVKRNWRFIRNMIKKFDGVFNKVDYCESLKVNIEKLKSFPKESLIQNGKPSEPFQNLTRAIAYDIDQLDGVEKNAKKIWDEILNDPEIDEDLKAAMKNSEIYGGVYKTETINNYLDELAKRYPDVKPSNWEQFKRFFGKYSDWSEEIAKAKKLATGGVNQSWTEIIFWIKTIFKFIWQNVKGILRLVFTGQFKSFRTLGKMFSTKGFGNTSRLASKFVLQYSKLLVYKQLLIIFPIIFNNILTKVLEAAGINVVEGEGTLKDRIWNDYMDELTTLSFPSDFFPFDFSVSVEMASDLKNFIYNQLNEDPNTTENELLISKNEAFNQWYNSLKKEEKQNLIKGLGESQNLVTAFGKLYLWTKETWTFNKKQFIEKNNLEDDDIEKIRNSLVAYSNLNVDVESFKKQVDEWKKIVVSPEQIKQAFSNDKNIKKASSLMDATIGAVRTADNSLYEPNYLEDYKFNFKKISYKPYYVVRTIVPETAAEKTKYRIYFAKDRDEVPTEADLNDIKSINPKGLGADGFFDNYIEAEKAVITLNSKQKLVQDPSPINLQELLKKL